MAELPARILDAIAALARPVCAHLVDARLIPARVAALRAALPQSTTILYAVKANGHPDVVAAFASVADGVEVASGGELALARAAGARRIAFSGPAKTQRELQDAVAAARDGIAVTMNVESVHEIRRLAHAGGSDAGIAVALRVNRRDAAGALTGSHRMAGVPTPFGIDESDLPHAVAEAATAGLRVSGFHLHAVSNNLDAAAHAAFIVDAVGWAREAAARHGLELDHVNVGGGFGIDYNGSREFDVDGLRGIDVDLPIVVEPGRYLAGPIGWYAAEVVDVKRTLGRWFAVLRGGTHHFRLPAAWGYSHPFTVVPVDDWPYPFDRPEARDVPIDAVGELCTPRDVLARDQHVERVRAGDVLVFANTGAYGWDISHHDFLRHPYPDLIVLR